MNDFDRIKDQLEKFAAERDWEKFHSPKNLAMALSVEASELVEHFQWLTEEESRSLSADKIQQIATEIADVQIYLINLASKLNVNLIDAVTNKIVTNAAKYPVPTKGRTR